MPFRSLISDIELCLVVPFKEVLYKIPFTDLHPDRSLLVELNPSC